MLYSFMDDGSYSYYSKRLNLHSAYETFISNSEYFLDKLYVWNDKINTIKKDFKLKLQIQKIDNETMFFTLALTNQQELYSITDFKHFYYSHWVGIAVKDSILIFFTWELTKDFVQYILNEGKLVKIEDKSILNSLNQKLILNMEWLDAIWFEKKILEPNFKITISPDFENEVVYVKNELFYNDEKVDFENNESVLNTKWKIIYERNLQKENEFKQKIADIFQKPFASQISLNIDEKIWEFFDKIEILKSDKIEILYEDNVKKITSNLSLSLNVKSWIDFFDLNTKLEIDGEEIKDLQNFLKSLKKTKWKFIKLKNNIAVVLNEKIKQQLEYLEEIWIDEKNIWETVKIDKSNIWLLLTNKWWFYYDEEFKKLKEKLENFHWLKNVKLPSWLNAKLRDYQKVGYNWLNFLNEYNFAWILADDMWLGKTLQTLSILQKVYNNKKNKKQSLIVCPTSLVFNWIQEAKKFTPNLKIDYIKDSNTWWKNISNDTNIIVVSYGLLANLVEKWEFEKKDFYYIILDEAQNIKNYNTKRAKAIYSLKWKYRLALTWTPIENNLLELWSIFNFLMPGFLWTVSAFKQKYVNNKWN